MLGLLARIVVGVVVAGAAGAAGYGVYKLLTRDKVKEEIHEKLEAKDEDFLQKAFYAKVKEKNSQKVTAEVFDSWDEPIADVDIEGDEVSDDIHVGDIISLVD